ncbi:hypothetical protein [Streptomyces sp. NPDC059080]|uniref:hypothetical protein n=1 Tax=Streptomyces sp. NPDC059080 TaxID=3346718 RepID=UPI0036B92053
MTRRSARRPGPAARDLRGPVLRTLLLLTALLLGSLPPPAGERGAVPSGHVASAVRLASTAYAPGNALAPAASSTSGAASGPRAPSAAEAASEPHAASAPDAPSVPSAPDAPSEPGARPVPPPSPPHSEAPHAAPFVGGFRTAPVVRCPAPVLRTGPGAGPEQTYHPVSGTPPAAVLPVPPYTGPRPPRIRGASDGVRGYAALHPARAPPSSGS